MSSFYNPTQNFEVNSDLIVNHTIVDDDISDSAAIAVSKLASSAVTVTAGNGLSGGGSVTLGNAITLKGRVIQQVRASLSSFTTTATTIPFDDTIPQSSEGAQLVTLAITPTNASGVLVLEFSCMTSNDSVTPANNSFALFQDSGAGAINAMAVTSPIASPLVPVILRYYMVAGTTSSTTFKVRFGGDSGNASVNGTTARKFGGVALTTLTITEYEVF